MKLYVVLTVSLLLSSCAAAFSPKQDAQPYLVSDSFRIPISDTNEALRSLPLPAGKIEASVYSFNDLTGQKKNPPNSSTFSTAVTQGADTILVKALLDSGWFIPRERKGLQNVLTEREILQGEVDESTGGVRKQRIRALKSASVIIEGGVVGYDSNVRSGGLGAKYLGIGSSTTYREDLVSVNLRVVSVIDGEVLLSVNSFKSIYSKIKEGGIFSYVTFNQILEAETGYSFNESILLSLTEAVESAVIQLISDGILLDLWRTSAPGDIDNQAFKKFGDPRLWEEFYKQREIDVSAVEPSDSGKDVQTTNSVAP